MLKQPGLADRHFPLFIDVADRKCLVVGGTALAAEKARLLLDFGALVIILSHTIGREIKDLCQNHPTCSVENRNFIAEDLNGVALVISATGKIEVDSLIASAAKTASVPVNVVDNKKLSNNIAEWQDLIGYIPQKINLLDNTIKHNIILDSESKDSQKLDNAIDKAGLRKFISIG